MFVKEFNQPKSPVYLILRTTSTHVRCKKKRVPGSFPHTFHDGKQKPSEQEYSALYSKCSKNSSGSCPGSWSNQNAVFLPQTAANVRLSLDGREVGREAVARA